jgi:hypothetical protein
MREKEKHTTEHFIWMFSNIFNREYYGTGQKSSLWMLDHDSAQAASILHNSIFAATSPPT